MKKIKMIKTLLLLSVLIAGCSTSEKPPVDKVCVEGGCITWILGQ